MGVLTVQMPVYAGRAIPAGIRRFVIERDGLTCRLCSRPVVQRGAVKPYAPDTLHLDHIVHWAAGGPSTTENLRVACAACNLGRPKPESVVRQSVVPVLRHGEEYIWPDGFAPPVVASDRGRSLLSVTDFAQTVHATPAQVFSLIGAGQLAATATSPVRVKMPKATRQKPAPLKRRVDEFSTTEAAWITRARMET